MTYEQTEQQIEGRFEINGRDLLLDGQVITDARNLPDAHDGNVVTVYNNIIATIAQMGACEVVEDGMSVDDAIQHRLELVRNDGWYGKFF